ncbi:MAG: alpha/beta fold hydrolase [Alphaproteobacteria bacterium]|nr:alpha/beta fold hydrolase [Alphaproteobacteria bacterium]
MTQSFNYLLVHGAWHGSWCWKSLILCLERLGHTVLAPDLPGHYKNPSDFKNITLKSYVDYIQNIVIELPDPVILVGHSMAGVVISQVAENMPEKVHRLVYVSGFIPENGGSLLDEEKKAATPTVAKAITINESEASISLPLHDTKTVSNLFYGNCSDETIKYSLSHLQKQPLLPFIGTVSISDQGFGRVPKLYIECLRDNAIIINDQRRMHSRVACDIITLDTDHSPFFSATDELAHHLLA